MTPKARRDALLAWLRDRPETGPLSTRAVYHGRPNAARRGASTLEAVAADLLALERAGLVRRLPGRPARWEARG